MTPSDFLEQWIDDIPKGRALDIGAGNGDVSIWLTQKGFQVDAIENNPDACSQLEGRSKGLDVTLHSMDVRDYAFPEGEYSLVYAGAILHFLKPTDLWVVVDRIVASLVPGGFFAAQVFTTDDPGYEELRNTEAEEIEPNTFISPVLEESIHYFMPGELARTFSALNIQAYEESRIVDLADPVGFRSGASIVARKG